MDIEEVAKNAPEKIFREFINPLIGLQEYQARKIAFNLDLKDLSFKEFVTFIKNLYKAYEDSDANLFEINPFSNPYLIGAVMVSMSALLSIIYIKPMQAIFSTVALGLGHWLIVIFFSGIIAFINSMYLYIRRM